MALRHAPRLPSAPVALLVAVLVSCGSGAKQPPGPVVSVLVVPTTADLLPSAGAQFVAQVAGTSDARVSWSVEEPGGGSVDDAGNYLAPGGTGIFHVVARSLADPSSTARATITVAGPPPPPPPPPPPDSPTSNLMGIAISAPLDWEAAQIYADMIRQSRDVVQSSGDGSVPVDGDGWPLAADFMVGVWAGINHMNGSYALSFNGRVSDLIVHGGELFNLSYSSASNLSTATVVVTDTAGGALQLVFLGAQRLDGSGHPGVRNVKLMRPIAPGSTQSYPATALFHTPLQDLVKKFRVVRFVDYLATNSNQQVTWSDRPLPSWMSFARFNDQKGYAWQGIGGPWEHVVLFCNESGRDAWINIPAMADDDYVLKVAQLFRYGSDGVLPYSSPQANPVYPPLAPGLRLYVEYSNELWNWSDVFSQTAWNESVAWAEVAGGKSPLDYDRHPDQPWSMRRNAKRVAEISLLFRAVFGDAQMMTRVRPVLMTQAYDSDGTLSQELRWLHGYANNGDGPFVPDPVKWNRPPRPVGYYVYGVGGSGYYTTFNPTTGADPAGLDIQSIWSAEDMDADVWAQRALLKDAYRAAAFGVKRIAYEGGPDLPAENGPVKAQAVMTFRGTPGLPDNMTDNFIRHHDAWSRMGGDLLVYYTAVHTYEWGFASLKNWYRGDVRDLASPKLLAVDELNGKTRAPAAIGVPAPGSCPGAAVALSSNVYEEPQPAAAGGRPFEAGDWAGYAFRLPDAAARTVKVALSSATGTVAIYWDGALVATRPAVSGTVSVPVSPAAAGLHGVLLRADAGAFTVGQVRVE